MTRKLKVSDVENLNPESLKMTLKNAELAEEDYQRKNAAKFRAVEQGMDYDGFKNLVEGSHLRSLSKEDKASLSKSSKGQWNRLEVEGTETGLDGLSISSEFKPPKTSDEFKRDWKRNSTALSKWMYCKLVDPNDFGKLFRVELDSQILDQQFSTAKELLESEDMSEEVTPKDIVTYLDASSTVRGFDMCLMFMGAKDKEISKAVFDLLCEKGDDEVAKKAGDLRKKFNL